MDASLLQQFVLVTSKSKLPDPVTALRVAAAILKELGPDTTNETETLGL